jgi:hypothetical protein
VAIGQWAMTPLHRAVDEYLALRRQLGVTLDEAGRVLTAFAAYAEQENAPYVTTALLMRWASLWGAEIRAGSRGTLILMQQASETITAIDDQLFRLRVGLGG